MLRVKNDKARINPRSGVKWFFFFFQIKDSKVVKQEEDMLM